MIAKSVAFNAAPPISPPSTSGFEKISLALSAFTLPPYKMETLSEIVFPYFFSTVSLINLCISCACSGEAVSPVPIAQTGS